MYSVSGRLSSALCVPLAPSLRGTVGLIDNLICSWMEEGDENMACPLHEKWRDKGAFIFLLSLSTSWTHLRPFSRTFCFQQWQTISFLKSIRSVIRKLRCGCFLSQESSCMQSGGAWSFVQFSAVQMGPILPGTAGRFSAYFRHDGELLYQI